MGEFFTQIIGQQMLKKRLQSMITARRLPHAMIIEGPGGSGKTAVALSIAASLVCLRREDEDAALPCCECVACRKMLNHNTPDLYITDKGDKATVGVELIRALKSDVYLSSTEFDTKVYIIDEADKMTTQAQNALLKILEEPPTQVLMLLLCESADSMLETVRSRAVTLRMAPLSDSELETYIEKDKKLSALRRLNKGKLDTLKKLCAGIPGRLSQLADSEEKGSAETDHAAVMKILTAVCEKRSGGEISQAVKRLKDKRPLLQPQLQMMLTGLRDLCLLKKCEDAQLLFFPDMDAARALCKGMSTRRLFALYYTVSRLAEELERGANVSLIVSQLCVKMINKAN